MCKTRLADAIFQNSVLCVFMPVQYTHRRTAIRFGFSITRFHCELLGLVEWTATGGGPSWGWTILTWAPHAVTWAGTRGGPAGPAI